MINYCPVPLNYITKYFAKTSNVKNLAQALLIKVPPLEEGVDLKP